jgi:predicted nucleic acid-binding protein
MPRPVYFDTSIFLEIFAKTSAHKQAIFSLLGELNDNKVAIYTSILTVQEASVLTYRRGQVVNDNHALINRMARIWGIDRQIALTTAKHEDDIRDMFKGKNDEEEMKHRRRWDCFHLATAQVRECTHLYTTDAGLMKRKAQLSIPDLQICLPKPNEPTLNFEAPGPILVKPIQAP